MGGHIGGVFFHTAKLVNVEKRIVDPNPVLLEKNRKPIFKKYEQCHQ
jgi:hypothetical protein